MPAWLYSVGQIYTNASNIKIPFLKLLMNLFTTIGPCLFGLGLVKCHPNLKPHILKIAKPLTLIALISFMILTLYAKHYAFALVNWKQWICPFLIPWPGFLASGLIAYILKLSKPQIYTIAIETGIQNVGIAFLIIIYNFPSPESDYAILPLITVAFLTQIPLWLCLIIQNLKNRLITKSHIIRVPSTDMEIQEADI